MDTTFKIVICAILFIEFGSAKNDTTEIPYSSSSLRITLLVDNINNTTSSNGSMSNSTVTAMETSYVTSPRLNVASTSQDSSKDSPSTQTDSTVVTSPTHPVPTASPTSPSISPPHPTSPHDWTSPHHATTPSTTSEGAHTTELPGTATGPQTTIAKGTTLSLTSASTNSTPGLPAFETGSPPQVATDSGSPSETQSSTDSKPTLARPNSPSAQAKGHVDTPSQLNVGSDATVVHQTPPLDPLIAGLVSAFIFIAVVISLFLFFKLRTRDNQPEFRRLQDLPMDDMMEDTPLSMYSY